MIKMIGKEKSTVGWLYNQTEFEQVGSKEVCTIKNMR